MQTRRAILIVCACAGAVASINADAFARNSTRHARAATAITQVFGDGIRLTAVAVEYDAAVRSSKLSPRSFRVEGRRITGIYAGNSADPGGRTANGRFVILVLTPSDTSAVLAQKLHPQNGPSGEPIREWIFRQHR